MFFGFFPIISLQFLSSPFLYPPFYSIVVVVSLSRPPICCSHLLISAHSFASQRRRSAVNLVKVCEKPTVLHHWNLPPAPSTDIPQGKVCATFADLPHPPHLGGCGGAGTSKKRKCQKEKAMAMRARARPAACLQLRRSPKKRRPARVATRTIPILYKG